MNVFSSVCGYSTRLIRFAVLLLAPAGIAVAAGAATGPSACRDTSERLAADELAGYGIRLRLVSTPGGRRVEVKLQRSVCIRIGENDCGTATYEFAEAGVRDRDSVKALDIDRSNDYEYTTSFAVGNRVLEHANLLLTYRGERCAGTDFDEHLFIVNLEEASKNTHGFF